MGDKYKIIEYWKTYLGDTEVVFSDGKNYKLFSYHKIDSVDSKLDDLKTSDELEELSKKLLSKGEYERIIDLGTFSFLFSWAAKILLIIFMTSNPLISSINLSGDFLTKITVALIGIFSLKEVYCLKKCFIDELNDNKEKRQSYILDRIESAKKNSLIKVIDIDYYSKGIEEVKYEEESTKEDVANEYTEPLLDDVTKNNSEIDKLYELKEGVQKYKGIKVKEMKK